MVTLVAAAVAGAAAHGAPRAPGDCQRTGCRAGCAAPALWSHSDSGADHGPRAGRVRELERAAVPVDGLPCRADPEHGLSLIHISEPTRLGMISYAVFCLKK